MAKWEYLILLYGSPTAPREALRSWRYWVWPWSWAMRRWVINPSEITSESKQVGRAEKARSIGKVWQAMSLLESALKELDADGWELVSASFSGTFFFYGAAVLRRPAPSN